MTIVLIVPKRVEPVRRPDFSKLVKLDIIIKDKKEVIEKARKDKPGLALWMDRSKLDQGQTAAIVYWTNKLAV